MRQHWSDNDRHHCSETALARLALEQGCEANSAPQELKNNNKKKTKKHEAWCHPKEHLQAPSFFWKVICFSFYRFAFWERDIRPRNWTCDADFIFKWLRLPTWHRLQRHTRKGPLQDFWAKDTTPLRAIRFSFSEMKCWCEARTPTPTWIDGSLTIMNRYLVTRLLIWMTQEWQRKNEIETFLPADGAAMTDTLLIDK